MGLFFFLILKPSKVYRAADERETAAMADLAKRFDEADENTPANDLQSLAFSVGKDHGFDPLRDWFKALYQVLLGQDQGPRFGSFAALYGVKNTVELIKSKLG